MDTAERAHIGLTHAPHSGGAWESMPVPPTGLSAGGWYPPACGVLRHTNIALDREELRPERDERHVEESPEGVLESPRAADDFGETRFAENVIVQPRPFPDFEDSVASLQE